MNALWDAYWPAFVAAAVLGVLAGAAAFRQVPTGRRNAALSIGLIVALGIGALWHGPVGTGERFADSLNRQSRQVLVNYEMTQIDARIRRAPLERTLLLSGPADDFQRGELARIMEHVPGVARARWTDGDPSAGLPLLAEVELGGLLGFGLGLLLSYLLELRRRYRAQWSW
jgi:hypothetical protein